MGRQLENDSLALLTYVSKQTGLEKQTYQSLSDGSGVPVETLRNLVCFHRHHGMPVQRFSEVGRYARSCYLCNTAKHYGFIFRVFPKGHRRIMDAVKIAYGNTEDLERYHATIDG